MAHNHSSPLPPSWLWLEPRMFRVITSATPLSTSFPSSHSLFSIHQRISYAYENSRLQCQFKITIRLLLPWGHLCALMGNTSLSSPCSPSKLILMSCSFKSSFWFSQIVRNSSDTTFTPRNVTFLILKPVVLKPDHILWSSAAVGCWGCSTAVVPGFFCNLDGSNVLSDPESLVLTLPGKVFRCQWNLLEIRHHNTELSQRWKLEGLMGGSLDFLLY